jgi:D-serine deaminase-like pyridoxal phosphate-dependent protein
VLATVVDVSGGALLDSGGRLVDGEFVTPPIQGADPEATYLRTEVGSDPLRPGDRVRLLCGYAPNAINLYDVIFIVRGEQVVDAWPIFPRGPGHDGFYGSLGAGLGG